MSNRTIVEINHDRCPRYNVRELLTWALHMRQYLGSADATLLPDGVTFLHYRHHSDPCPLAVPPREHGDWRNRAYIRDLADRMIAEEVGKTLAPQASAERDSA